MASFCFAQDDEVNMFKINASRYNFGDDTWEFNIVEYDDRSGADFNYLYERFIVDTNLSGSTILEIDQVQDLKNIMLTYKFNDLPNDIAQESYIIHAPIYHIEVCYSDKCHKVTLDENGNDYAVFPEDRKNFLYIWDYIMTLLPDFYLPQQWPVSEMKSDENLKHENKPNS